jgi:transposase-like protein
MSAPPTPRCPMCDADAVEVVEDVSDEVTVFGCRACGTTWADRTDR